MEFFLLTHDVGRRNQAVGPTFLSAEGGTHVRPTAFNASSMRYVRTDGKRRHRCAYRDDVYFRFETFAQP
jgi:hypothetical protein